jgi:hypothetical protein
MARASQEGAVWPGEQTAAARDSHGSRCACNDRRCSACCSHLERSRRKDARGPDGTAWSLRTKGASRRSGHSDKIASSLRRAFVSTARHWQRSSTAQPSQDAREVAFHRAHVGIVSHHHRKVSPRSVLARCIAFCIIARNPTSEVVRTASPFAPTECTRFRTSRGAGSWRLNSRPRGSNAATCAQYPKGCDAGTS